MQGTGTGTGKVEVRDGRYSASSGLEKTTALKGLGKIRSFITCLGPPLYSVPSSRDSRMLELILVLASPLPSPPLPSRSPPIGKQTPELQAASQFAQCTYKSIQACRLP